VSKTIKKLIFLITILIFFQNSLLANDTLKKEYQQARMDYLKAVLKKDDDKKITALKKIITIGDKLNKDTTPDRNKLESTQNQIKKTTKNVDKSTKLTKPVAKTSNNTREDSTKYPVRNIFVKDNEIVVTFNKDITKKDIKKFELNSKNSFKDVFDIQGYYPKAKETVISMNGLDKITVGQYKPNTFRVVLKDNKKIDTYYKIQDKRTVVIKVTNLPSNTKSKVVLKEKEVKKQPIIKQTKLKPNNKYIDTKNSIRQIYTDQDSLTVRFNKNFNKNMVKYLVVRSKGKYIHRFDIKGVYKYANPIKLDIPNLDKVTIYQKSKNLLRVDFVNDSRFKTIYIVNKRSLVVKLRDLQKKEKLQVASTGSNLSPHRNKVIVIDAGHGGKDAGGVGPKKRYEKHVVLAVAKNTYNLLKSRGYKNVFLTRHTDRFIKVNNRTKLANKKNADIFLSIHANSIIKAKAHKVQGIETFFLSPARSERAKRVAAKENKSDVRQMSNSTKSAFLESLSRPRITASHKLAIDVQAGMLNQTRTKYKNVKDSGVREGPFWVLVGAQMPSILIELGYISHPTESARLVNKEYQRLLANGIANGIESYFSKNP
jgi:N-acetylmuramoyl-L-alanine amidase